MKVSNGILKSAVGLALASFFAVSPVHAKGGGSTGGADAYECVGSREILADFLLSDSTQLVNQLPIGALFDKLTSDSNIVYDHYIFDYKKPGDSLFVDFILSFLDNKDHLDANDIRTRLYKLNFNPGYLKKLKTGVNFPFFSGCHKQQLAIQYFKFNEVQFDSEVLQDMGNLSIAFLMIHEAYVNQGMERFGNLVVAETYARNKVGTIVNDPKFGQLFINSKFVSDTAGLLRYLYEYLQRGKESAPDPSTLVDAFSASIQAMVPSCKINQDVLSKISSITYAELFNTSEHPYKNLEDKFHLPLKEVCSSQ